LTVLSSEALAMLEASGLYAPEVPALECPGRVAISLPSQWVCGIIRPSPPSAGTHPQEGRGCPLASGIAAADLLEKKMAVSRGDMESFY
jgi:hypothetical protein